MYVPGPEDAPSDPGGDGARFLPITDATTDALRPDDILARPRINIVLHWFDRVREQAPVRRQQ